jgi:hypothetical protein
MDYGCARWGECDDYRGRTSTGDLLLMAAAFGAGFLLFAPVVRVSQRGPPWLSEWGGVLAGLAFWVPLLLYLGWYVSTR